jgi:polar amino acid transport system permease protein
MQAIIHNFVNLGVLRAALPDVLRGFTVTVLVAVLIAVLGILGGLLFAIARCAGVRAINIVLVVYIGVFRTLPQLVVIVFLYFALPYAGLTLTPFSSVVLALAAVLSAFAAEIFTAAIGALPHGQWEAARSLGLATGRPSGS